jgi:Transposase DDE domain
MAEQPSSALTMLTAFFSAEHIAAAARQTGVVQRTSNMTGHIFLALVTFGVGGDAKTTLAPLAANVAQLRQPVAVSPEAIDQRMNQRALAFLPELIRQALAKLQSCQAVYEEHLFPPFARVHLADSTGFELPERVKHTFPGSGGSAAPAGATLQLLWDYKSRVLHHCALTPWHIPAQKSSATVVTFARQDDLLIFDLGYFKLNAWASIADAHAYFLCRLNHQTTIWEAVADRVVPVALAPCLTTVARSMVQQPIVIGVKEQVASRLLASRVPEAVVNSRRRMARKNAKQKGSTPAQAHLALVAWNLCITNVPQTIGQPQTVLRV